MRILKNPWKDQDFAIRIEEELDDVGSIVNRQSMVADHVCLTIGGALRGEEDLNTSYQNLNKLLAEFKGVRLQQLPYARYSFYFNFEPTSLELLPEIIKRARSFGFLCGPDFF